MNDGNNVNETQRLTTLHSLAILDTKPNPAIDGIVKAAAGVCSAPMALVTLVDETRQWFKARYGLDDVTETHRSVAFCDHAIRGTGVMVVEDASMDDRFQDNPLVTGKLSLRFYAGAPLIAPNGARLGALCILDQKPGKLATIQAEALSRLAETVVELLEKESLARSGEFTVPDDGADLDTPAQITKHARNVLLEHGPADFSVRKVAKEAGLSLSNVQHHFPSKAALVAAIVDNLRRDFFWYYETSLVPIPNAIDRFVACAKHILNQGPDSEMIILLRDLWSMAARDPKVAITLTEFYVDCRRLAASVLKEANPDLDASTARFRACTAVALLSGAFLYTEPWVAGARVDGLEYHILEEMTKLAFVNR